jgi:hypothetical protein
MTQEPVPQAKSPTPEKSRAHGVQSDWLTKAIGQSVEITLDGGSVLYGRLINHDIYCLSLDEAGQKGATLIYKQSIAFIRVKRD